MVDERSILQGLMQRGIPAHIAQGFVMNMRDESGLNPGINEVAPLIPGSRGGFGLYQLTGPRRTAYEQFAGSRGVDPANVDAQLDFLVSELQGPESRAAQSIFATQDVPSAAAAIARDFLRPAPENLQKRVAQYTGGTAMQPQGLLGTVSTQGQEPEQLPFFQRPGTADLLDTLAIGFSGMSMRPNQALIQSAQERIKGRRESAQTAKQRNATAAWLRSQGREDLASALESGALSGRDAASAALQPPADDRTAGLKEYEAAVNQGFQGSFLDYKTALAQAGRPETNVNVGTGESAFNKKTGEVLATEAADIVTQGSQAQRSLGQIQVLESALQRAPSGALGSLTNMAAGLGIKTEGASDIELANSIISQLVPQQRPPGSGVMSDADLELFKQSLPRLINTREGNQMIINTMKSIAEYDMQRASIARQLQLNQITQEQAFEAYQSLGNPIPPELRTGGGAVAAPAGNRIRYDAQGNRLP